MARKPKTNGVGHNSGEPLSDDERAALVHYFSLRIRGQRRKAAEAKAAYDLERGEVNALFSKARGDLLITRKDFEEVLALQDMTEVEFQHHEAKRYGRLADAGLVKPVQLDMFQANDTVDDAIDAEANGFRAGRRADDPFPPDYIAGILHPDWMKGYHRGQAANGEQLGIAEKVIAARDAKKPELKASEDPDVAPDEDATDPEVVEKKARKLKKAGWAEPTKEEAAFA